MDDQKSRILVVDDEANNRKFLQQILKEYYRLSFAVNGKEALDVCRKVKPDMILLDIMMPEMDGFEACKHLKADVETADIPVIFITAMNSIEDEAAGFTAGCVDYITKPISRAIVLARINTHLMISHQKKEIELQKKKFETVNKQLEYESRRLAGIIAGTRAGTWEWNVQTGQTVFNDLWAEMLGYTLDEISPTSIETWAKFVHPDDLQESMQLLDRHFQGELDYYEFESRMQHKDGGWIWVLDRGKVIIWTDDGKPLWMLGTHQDITERKHAQVKLSESESNFRTFFESINDMIFVGNLDGKVFYTNSTVKDKLGYSPEEMLSIHILDLHQPDRRDDAEMIFNEMFQGKRTTCPLPLIAKNGNVIPVETRVWFGRWNGADCIFGISKDLSAEQEAQQRFESLFRNNPALMALTILPERIFVDVNDAFLTTLGYSLVEVIGKTSKEINLFVDEHQIELITKRLKNEQRILEVEMQVRHKSGAIVDGLFSGEIIVVQRQHFLLTVMIDISERKQMEKRLREAYEMMEQQVKERTRELENTQKELINKAVEAGRAQLSAMVLHNIGNAITPVSVNTEKLKTRNIKKVSQYLLECYNDLAGHKEELSHYITMDPRGIRVAEFMTSLIQSLKEEHQKTDEVIDTISAGIEYVSRILSLQRAYYAPEKNEMKENINLNQLMEDALKIHESSIDKREIRIEKNFLADIPIFPMEKNKLMQVLVNLVKNSCDAIDEQSQIDSGQQNLICVTTFRDTDKVGVSISDSGCGVEKERQNEIFEFGISSKGSSGFGLYYCKNFVEANNGTLRLESEGKGKGAKFTLEILLNQNLKKI